VFVIRHYDKLCAVLKELSEYLLKKVSEYS
jgi:hypothetical protein